MEVGISGIRTETVTQFSAVTPASERDEGGDTAAAHKRRSRRHVLDGRARKVLSGRRAKSLRSDDDMEPDYSPNCLRTGRLTLMSVTLTLQMNCARDFRDPNTVAAPWTMP